VRGYNDPLPVQGPVLFDERGDRRGLTQIEQLQNNREVQVGVYNPSSPLDNKISWHADKPIYWKGIVMCKVKIRYFCKKKTEFLYRFRCYRVQKRIDTLTSLRVL